MAAVVVIGSGCGLTIGALRRNQPNKSKLVLYKLLLSRFKQLYTSSKTEHFSYKDGCGRHGHRTLIMYLKEELA